MFNIGDFYLYLLQNHGNKENLFSKYVFVGISIVKLIYFFF